MKVIHLLLVICFAYPSHAFSAGIDDDLLLRESQSCTSLFAQYEAAHEIPFDLLKAVSITESGLWHKRHNQSMPWPWSINVEGKGYVYQSKEEAIKAVKKFQAKGHKSIDVGCMQINLMYHPEAFANIESAFEPKNNIAYAASFLRGNYAKHDNWPKAVAAYHSENKVFGVPYAKKVLENWRNLSKNPSTLARFDRNNYLASVNNKKQRLSKAKNFFAYINKKDRRKNSNIFINVKAGQYASNRPINGKERELVENLTKNVLKNYADNKTNKPSID